MGENKQLQIYVLAGILLLLIIGGSYSYFGILAPLNEEIVSVDTQIKQQQAFLNKKEEAPPVTANVNENTYTLQEEVPVKPLVDQLMLQFEKAEVLSDSLILTMQFKYEEDKEEKSGDETESANSEQITETTTTTDPADVNNNNATPAQGENTADKKTDSLPDVNVTPEALPEGVKKITAEMSVTSKNYDGLLKFLKTIEDFKRITVIEGLSFQGLDELELASAETDPDQLTYQVTIAAYYLPELTEYLKDLPKGEFPAPNGKENPLTGAEPKKNVD